MPVAVSGIDFLQASPPNQTIRAYRNCPLRVLDRLENRTIVGTCLPAQMAIATAQNG